MYFSSCNFCSRAFHEFQKLKIVLHIFSVRGVLLEYWNTTRTIKIQIQTRSTKIDCFRTKLYEIKNTILSSGIEL